ncbi:hypothetical protein F441_03790 [Phytophthora nicotianae CJ01A1]|uniref:RxLR effector protein n=6 Tax=Phytophthora nicotianae TaxID=4792 RepID=W2ZVB3_PHYNI|nr:hypothetical protein PPTG_08641 [Phytophthora nicotianae INRA-310]ETI53196.1 hypothetical protein F443_03810 [Phytophthora nicotianae P1569]ETK93044.1 hypothetical protein L915_03701 [Phytophthora nicotianae]ETO81871.1 hypothetical protein F444_03885 [Phytophthora nicotianae P1976]ETP23015.1 hypothetical protein F441_03790 [Phytophthora nicotianae CJ01A1]ETP50970.1 hypothetical protein F442_03805 [Phytophthora nicotianae P10297]KUF82447.1 hypothetical protein AM587_10011068 [Phytophthora n
MRTTYVILVAAASILASTSDASAVKVPNQNQLPKEHPIDVAQVTEDKTSRFLRRREISDENEERSSLGKLATKLDDMATLSALRAVKDKDLISAWQHLQQITSSWKNREAILEFIQLDQANRKKVLKLIVENAAKTKGIQ